MELAALLRELKYRAGGPPNISDPLSAARRYLSEQASDAEARMLRRLLAVLMWGRAKVHEADLACFTANGALIAAALIDARLRGLYPYADWRTAILALAGS